VAGLEATVEVGTAVVTLERAPAVVTGCAVRAAQDAVESAAKPKAMATIVRTADALPDRDTFI
jgi:hypothetical protein